jgi:hypothetical protein
MGNIQCQGVIQEVSSRGVLEIVGGKDICERREQKKCFEHPLGGGVFCIYSRVFFHIRTYLIPLVLIEANEGM